MAWITFTLEDEAGRLSLAEAYTAVGTDEDDEDPDCVDSTAVEARRYTMRFENDFLDLDADTVISCGRTCAFPDGTDLKIAFDPTRTTHSVVVQNQGTGVEIAYLNGAVFGDITTEDARNATFTASLINVPFDRNRVILIRTDQGLVFKLGNPVEADLVVDGVTFDAALLD